MNGIIVKALSGFYYVSANGAEYECRARGSFRKSGVSPLVGDRVEFEPEGTGGTVTEVLPRKSFLLRPPVANIDRLFIVSSYEKPAPNTAIIDRMTAMALYAKILPVPVFNKCDAGDFTPLERLYRAAGFKTYTVSAKTGEGIEALKAELGSGINAFTGNTGVGKSSLLNAVLGVEALKTGEISDKLGRGRHTTRHTELIPFSDGYVADTPGFSTFDTAAELEFKEHLIEFFPDLYEYSHECRFSSCTHTCECGCGVLAAVDGGKLAASRHESYKAIFNELKDLKPWNTNKR